MSFMLNLRVMSLKSDKEKSQYLQDLIKKTYLTDVIERNHIQKDISILDDLLKMVASSIGRQKTIIFWSLLLLAENQ